MRKTTDLAAVTAIAFLTFGLALGGCSLGPRETSRPQTYLLNPDLSAKTFYRNSGKRASAILVISAPKAQAGFDTARMVYLLRPHQMNYYALNQWVDTPARMLMQPLAQAMAATGLWSAVVQMPSTVRADYRLDCDSLAVEQQFFSTPSRVRVALHAQLIEVKRREIVAAREFEVFATSPSEDAYGGVMAANQAIAQLLDQLTAWVGASMTENSEMGE